MLSKTNGDALRRNRTIADSGEEVVELGILRKRLQQFIRFQLDVDAPQLSLEDFLPVDDVFVTFLAAKPAADLIAGRSGGDIVRRRQEPIPVWASARAAGDDLDDLTVLQPVVERHELIVDLG